MSRRRWSWRGYGEGPVVGRVAGRVVRRGVGSAAATVVSLVVGTGWAMAKPTVNLVPPHVPSSPAASASASGQALSGAMHGVPNAAPFTQAWATLQQRIELEQQRQARVPVPIEFRFKPKKIGTLDIRPDLAAAVVADLNRDGRMEAFIASEHAVTVIDLSHSPRIIANVRFPDVAQRRSRQLVGSMRVAGAEVRAQVSSHANAMVVQWNGGSYIGTPSGVTIASGAGNAGNAPTATAAAAGFEFCKDQTWALHPGRNWFDTGVAGQGVYNVVCRDDLVDAQGRFWSVRASVSEHDLLHVEAQPPCNTTCDAVQRFDMAGAGYAFTLDDLNQNGVPEVLASAASANADTVTITELSLPPRVVLRRRFAAGVVALLSGDFDGDGKREAIALVRAGTWIDVWRLQ